MPAYIAFGANLGDPLATYRDVQERLYRSGDVETFRASPLYQTTPVGGPPGQPEYFNGAIEIQTRLGPAELHAFLVGIQKALGRSNQGHWQPRIVDLDLILFDSWVVETPDLVVPHPRAHQRWFVLRPIVDLFGQAMHPVLSRTAVELLSLLESRNPTILVFGGSESDGDRIRDRLISGWNVVRGEWSAVSGQQRTAECPRHYLQDPNSEIQAPSPLPHSISAPTVLHCPVPRQDVNFLRLAGTIVGAYRQPPSATRSPSDAAGDDTIRALVLQTPGLATTPMQAWPAVDLRANSMDGSIRLLDNFLESRLPGRTVEGRQE